MSSIIAKIRQQEASERIKRVFSNLKDGEFELTSPFDSKYNCIAHAAEKNDIWWWSVDKKLVGNDVFWFDNVPGEATVENFISAFSKLGYKPCENSKPEQHFEKVAIYVSTKDELHAPKGSVTHMARQLSDGKWTSKLGNDVDISHNTLQAVEGNVYGVVKQILRRKK
jgi:hypothetical protein